MRPRIRIVAPSAPVAEADLLRGLGVLRAAGFDVAPDPGVLACHFFYAGDDAHRTDAFWSAATDDDAAVVWCARGGSGAARLLPELERRTFAHGVPPRKLLCGYSDITALHEFVRSRWGWATLHCDMVVSARFTAPGNPDLTDTLDMVRRGAAGRARWMSAPLRPMGAEPLFDLTGVLTGGNLAVLASLAGTPFAPAQSGGRFLFLEEVGEAPYRIDRLVTQLRQSGAFRGVTAVLLGSFTDCVDRPPMAVDGVTPLRPTVPLDAALAETFGRLSRELGVPVLAGIPAGHGEDRQPLPLGAVCRLTGHHTLELVSWDWPGT